MLRLTNQLLGAVIVVTLAGCTSGQAGDPATGAGGNGNGTSTGTAGMLGSSTAGSLGSSGEGTLGSSGEGAASPNGGSRGESITAMGIALSGAPLYSRFVRLTNAQWAASVKEILRLEAPSALAANFEKAVSGATDFSNNELLISVNQRSWADFQAAAEALADQVTASDAALNKVYGGTDASGLIQAVGRRAYRRPLSSAELAAYTALFNSGSMLTGSKSTFAKGAAVVIRALLQSPNFLYRTELGTAGTQLSGYEVAAKLSLWLRGATPSDELLDSADALVDVKAASTLATKLMGEPAALAVMRDFQRQLLHFDRFATISKLNVPSFSDSLNAEYQEASYLFFDRIFSAGLGVKEMLTSTVGFMGPGMAKLYGVQVAGAGFSEQDLGATRVGFFSQLPYLTLNGLNEEPDPIHRGVSINLDVLCAPLGPPSAMLPPIPPLQAGQTNRQRITTLTSGCGSVCHNSMINPIGFAFEHFDGMGQYRVTENGGLTIDSSGSYTLTEGQKSFQNAGELMAEIASGQQAHLCYAKKLASFALQRDIVGADLPLLDALSKVSMASGGSVKKVMAALVENDSFRKRYGGNP